MKMCYRWFNGTSDDTRVTLKEGISEKIWVEAVNMADDIGNICTSTVNKNESSYGIFHNKKPIIFKHLVQFGRVVYVTIRKIIKGRMKNKINKWFMVGYAKHR